MSDTRSRPASVTGSRSNRLALIAASVFAAMVGLLAAVLVFAPRNVEIESGVLLKQPRELRSFQLGRADGGSFDERDFQGHWSLVFAGFTHCPDICPSTLALLNTVSSRLAEAGKPVQVVFVSVDPERDTPVVMRGYVGYFDPSFIAITGPEDQLSILMSSLGLIYVKVPGDVEGSYTMDHSAALVLINPEGRIAGYFAPPHRIEALTADLARVMS